jgi:hypothetical protein
MLQYRNTKSGVLTQAQPGSRQQQIFDRSARWERVEQPEAPAAVETTDAGNPRVRGVVQTPQAAAASPESSAAAPKKAAEQPSAPAAKIPAEEAKNP